jgi:hypothetical protein
MATARDIIAEVNSLSEQPDSTISPVTVGENSLSAPPAAQALVEGGEGNPQAFLVR